MLRRGCESAAVGSPHEHKRGPRLGFADFYRDPIGKFSDKAALLHAPTRHGVEFTRENMGKH